MMLRVYQIFDLGILLLEQEVDALKGLCLQLVYYIIQNLEARNVDDAVVVWRVWNLNSNAEDSDKD